ncbi:MAG: glycosyltransferase [Anaerolineales bacterium]|nr:glycosyltransferase [Anaerolineales bacterium]
MADAHRVTFLGGLHWPPNAEGIVWFVRAVWPLIRQQAPNAVLTVIGKDPPAELRDTVLQNLDVTGYVDDPMPYLKETAVFIVPLPEAACVKILDAWRWGLPVVSSTIGAEGIAVENGENALLADTPEAFAQAVTSVLQNRTVADALAAKGRQTVEIRYNWRTVYRAWNAVYR